MGRESIPDIDELRWLREVLGGYGRGEATGYLCRSSLAQPELLIPLRPRKAAGAAMRRHHDARPWRQRASVVAAQTLGRLGGFDYTPGDRIELVPFALVETLALLLGEPVLVPAIGLGPRRRNRKPVIQLLRPDGRTVGFAKVGWSPLTRELVTNEAHWLRHLDGRMPGGLSAPAVLLNRRIGEVDVVVTTPVRATVRSRRRQPIDAAVLNELARRGTDQRATLAELDLIGDLEKAGLAAVVDLGRMLERHGDVVIETGLWHGDLTPWNTATERGETAIWDWEFAADGRPIGFDALHIAFELVRRQARGNESAAIATIERDAASILAPATPTDEAVAATIDLYLCELLVRERRLAGEGWEPTHLAPLTQELIDALERRLH